jgi:hypothetical protein
MKKSLHKLLIGAGAMALLAGSPAMAIDLYGFASYWDKKDLDGKWGGGVGLSLPLLTKHLKLDGRVYFFENSSLGRNDSLTLIPIDLGLQVHLLPNGTLNPYALGGITYMYADADRVDVDSGFGGYFGGGLEWAFPSSVLKLFGEVVYRYQDLDADALDDLDISGVVGNIGLKLHF